MSEKYFCDLCDGPMPKRGQQSESEMTRQNGVEVLVTIKILSTIGDKDICKDCLWSSVRKLDPMNKCVPYADRGN